MLGFGEIIADKSYIFHKPYKKTGQNCGQFVLKIGDLSKIMGYEDINKWTDLRVMNTYSVIMVGPSGSGKSVFLASMHELLSTQAEELGFFLELEGEQRKRLNRIYKQLTIEERWPKATQLKDISEWIFTCNVQAENLSIYPACKFVYYDYAGGRLTDELLETNQEDQKFQDETLKKADAMLGLLDGEKISSLMRNEQPGRIWVRDGLKNTLDVMQRIEKKPLHFVISKWDIVKPNYSLREIRDRLLQIPQFANLVKTRIKGNSPVRLIPISSVGLEGFATLQEDGSMAINLDVDPQPFQVEAPLACVLSDLIKLEIDKKIEEMKTKQEDLANPAEVKPDVGWLDWLKSAVGGGMRAVKQLLPEKLQLAEAVLENLIECFERPVNEKFEAAEIRTKKLRATQAELLKKVADEKSALNCAVASFTKIGDRLERDFPESYLREV